MQVALKVDVDTYHGTLEGVPALLRLFDIFNVKATFLFSLGPDHTGRALRRIFRPGFLGKVKRTSVISHYGLKTVMYGVCLPGPDISRKAGYVMREVRDRGHEVGIHCYDHVRWQDFIAGKDFDWTNKEMCKANAAFRAAVFQKPSTIGAAGWQLNKHVIALEEKMGFSYASDVRGQGPFYPHMEGVSSRCIQIPTTLPTLDELLGYNGNTPDNVHIAIEKACVHYPVHGHVYTLHAELEGKLCLPAMQRLLRFWQDQGTSIFTLRDLYRSLDPEIIPGKTIVWRELPGRTGTLACEGELFPVSTEGLTANTKAASSNNV